METRIYLAAALITVALLLPRRARATCGEDCDSTYQSDVESCSQQFSDPEDGNDLSLCVQNSKDDYSSCLDDCASQND
jgi:hypothetical protein